MIFLSYKFLQCKWLSECVCVCVKREVKQQGAKGLKKTICYKRKISKVWKLSTILSKKQKCISCFYYPFLFVLVSLPFLYIKYCSLKLLIEGTHYWPLKFQEFDSPISMKCGHCNECLLCRFQGSLEIRKNFGRQTSNEIWYAGSQNLVWPSLSQGHDNY